MPAEVQVLLATLNGERFLREQIDSILAQTLPGVSILARDDGSSDSTPAILGEYAQRLPERVRILQTDAAAGGAKTNFLALLQASTAPYVAFADQDDLWLPEKLAREMDAMRSLERLHEAARPLLVFSDLRVVNERLEPIAGSFWAYRSLEPRNIHRLESLLMENVVTGCTVILNRPLRDLALDIPGEAHMHDWWVALLACLFGHAASVREPLVLYRQHPNNLIGACRAPSTAMERLRRREGRRERWQMSVSQAAALLRIYAAELPSPARNTLEALVRCDASSRRTERLMLFLRHRFFIRKFASNLGTALLLWDKTQ